MIAQDILSHQNCAVWYRTDPSLPPDEELFADLEQMQLFVIPITARLLCEGDPAEEAYYSLQFELLETRFPHALEKTTTHQLFADEE